ncbi:GNAT family N-acetyltransferase [Massilia norwichensis]|uniref:GNAT family N-acetyltransferase n=1 Tax=Massilia norwichensis TaxID=1442366 RepID=A0ABT2A8Q5_9BURK|nr:GNAT family N-acetyltransferase [Massilia norwichensis]MCS0590566.1 GNAT family N-acetyltransferase [Massilia norwichensis]
MMLPPSLLLRPAADADAGFLQALYASTRDDLRQLPLPPAQLEQLIAMQQRAHEAGWRAAFPNAEVLVLEHDGMAAGKAVLDTTGHDWRLVELALLPVLRGRGLGTALLTALQARARQCGASIGLAVLCTNTGALRLYERAGFRITGGNALQHQMAWLPEN